MNSIEPSLKLLNTLIAKKKKVFKDPEGEVERYSSTDIRYDKLLKKGKQSHLDNDGWFIYVPSCFNDCLDISKTDRIIKDNNTQEKKNVKVWTQGSRFSFHSGCILYNTSKAYQKWDYAIKQIKYCISIHNGISATPAIRHDERLPGIVEFSVLTPSSNKDRLEEIGKFNLTQDEFVRFLIKGNPEIIPSKDCLFTI